MKNSTSQLVNRVKQRVADIQTPNNELNTFISTCQYKINTVTLLKANEGVLLW